MASKNPFAVPPGTGSLPAARSSTGSARRRRRLLCWHAPAPMLLRGRHSSRSGRTTRGSGDPGRVWPRRTGRAGVLALWRRGRLGGRLRCRHLWRGCWVLRPCPDAYLQSRPQPKQGPFPRPPFGGGVTGRLRLPFGTTGPSDSRPARSPFAVGLWGSPSFDVNRRDGSLLFRIDLSPHALLPTPRASRTAPVLFSGAVCCLRRDMSGSACPTFRVFISRGCKLRLMLGLRTCSPPADRTTR